MNRERLLERFIRYVQVDTTAVESTDQYPSSAGQIELGKLLLAELQSMGLADAHQDEYGLVYATVPGNLTQATSTVAFNAHLDTSPETTGHGVKPQVINAYAGGDIPLPGDDSKVIRWDDNPELAGVVGKTLITTDGTTLLGGDDKAGVAIIMELAQHLVENPELKHGDVRLLFTCDEEIGRGVQHVSFEKLNSQVCYTFDGGGQNEIDVETFSADVATVTVKGVNIHTAMAKDRLVNSLRALSAFINRLPADLSPERTQDREGFLHPYTMEGSVAQSSTRIILRDFNTSNLEKQADILRRIGSEVERDFPGIAIEINIQRQYRNLGDGLAKEPRAVAYAEQAHRNLGRTAKQTIVRGGTDGSMMTEKGLPTPNLSSGQHNLHSPLEWACLDEMLAAVEVGVEIVQCWAKPSG